MMNVVLVDDRRDIVLGISRAVDWAARDVTMQCFFNGADALAYCLDHPVDLVITDIRMPFMTGLELTAALREHKLDIRVVLLTGYEDFAYAREALRLGAVEYLTKPVRIEMIEELITREYALAEQRRAEQQSRAEDWRRYQRSLPALRRQWAEQLQQSRPLDEPTLQKQFRELGFSLSPERFVVAVVAVTFEDGSGLPEKNELDLLRYAVENMGCELIRQQYPCECIDLGGTELAFLLNYAQGERPLAVSYHVGERFEELAQKCRQILKITLAGGIGSCAPQAGQLQKSWRDAVRALEQNFYAETPCILSSLEIPDDDRSWERAYPYDIQDEAVQLLRRRELEQAQQALDRLFDALAGLTSAAPAVLREHLLAFLLRIFHECGMDQYLHVASALEQFQSRRTLLELREWFGCLTAYLKDQIDENASQVAGGVYKVKHYIDGHYAEAISLKSMAALAFVSPAYLSFSFKEVLGVNFNEYLTTVRMEHAKELLAGRQYRVYEVCELVGYHDKKYFSDLFKKHTGVFPKEWR